MHCLIKLVEILFLMKYIFSNLHKEKQKHNFHSKLEFIFLNKVSLQSKLLVTSSTSFEMATHC